MNTFQLSRNSAGIVPTCMTNVLQWTVQKDILSFAGGMPDPNLFPLKEVTTAAEKVAKDYGSIILQYAPAQGVLPLKEFFREHFRKKGIVTDLENITPINGVQQGTHLSSQLFLNSGDQIVVTSPSYFGSLQAFDAYLPKYLPIALTEQGLDLDELEVLFKKNHPKFFYVIPNFQNPSGITLPEEQRPKIVELSQKYQVPIIEDDVFGDLYFDKPYRTLKSYAENQVIYLTSISKSVSAGFRLGYAVVPESLRQKYLNAKELNDVSLNTYVQYLTYEVVRNGGFERLLASARKTYEERRNALLSALEHFCSDLATWTKPAGGMFLWLYLKQDINAKELLEYCGQRGLVFVAGPSFFPHGLGGHTELRLSYSNLPPEKIRQGVELFSRYTREYLEDKVR